MDRNKISIGIKTFLRDECLYDTVSAITVAMPEIRMIIADDGEMTEEKDEFYAGLILDGHTIITLPFDSGFGHKSNRIVDSLRTPYLLIGSDDFDFRPPSVRQGIEQLAEVLDNTDIDIVSGRVRGPYEFNLEFQDNGRRVIEHPVHIGSPTPWYVECDLTVNYSLMRSQVFDKVRWDNDIRIGGGEHGAFFVDVKRAGLKTAYVPGVKIAEQIRRDSDRYQSFRNRANNPERPCFDRRGIREYVLGNGQIDYKR